MNSHISDSMASSTRWLAVTVLLALTIASCGGETGQRETSGVKAEGKTPKDQVVLPPDEQATGKIETRAVIVSDAPHVLRVAGRIVRADDRTWNVGVRTSGMVRSVYVNLGDAVQRGKVLARYRADEVREERAKYRTAMSELQRLQAAATLAQRNLERMQALLELKAASVLQVDQARQDAVAADAAVKNAQTEVDRARGVLEDDLHVPAESVSGDEQSDSIPILAPGPGYILEKKITPGDTVAPGQDAFVIGDLSQVWMIAAVRQDDLGELRVGQSATVTLPGVPGAPFVGKITNLGQELDPATRVLQVRIVLNNPHQRLRPEMLANAELPVGAPVSSLTVPSDAVQQINGQDIVFVRTMPDRFVVRPVQVGPTSNGNTPVIEGLKPGEQVVVHGSFVLKSHLLRSSMEE